MFKITGVYSRPRTSEMFPSPMLLQRVLSFLIVCFYYLFFTLQKIPTDKPHPTVSYSGTTPYDHLVITTNFLCPERIISPAISLVLQPR